MGPGWKVGRVAGIDIAIHPSWLIIAFLVTFTLAADQFPRQFPGWTSAQYWIVGGVTALLFFGSVLAHELSHAVLARRFGMDVRGITLFIFGGATHLEDDAARPRDEALIAVAGPATSLIIGGGMLVVARLVGESQEQVSATFAWLGLINLVLGAFNLIPGFPLDGGRLLRALIWRLRGDRFVATRNAATVGRIFAYVLIALGVLVALRPGGVFSGIWLALIGWFLSNAAEATAAQAGVDRSLTGVRVREVMDPNPPAVSPNESVSELVTERLLRGPYRSFLVLHDDGGLAGMVTMSDVQRIPRESWDETRVTDIMTRFADLATVGPDDQVADALKLLQAREVGQLPVVEEGRTPVGLLTRTGILRLIEARLKLGA